MIDGENIEVQKTEFRGIIIDNKLNAKTMSYILQKKSLTWCWYDLKSPKLFKSRWAEVFVLFICIPILHLLQSYMGLYINK